MSAGHGHSHALPEGDEFAGRDTARRLRIITIACAVVVVMAAAVLWPSRTQTGDPLGLQADAIAAHVIAVEERPCAANPGERCAVVSIEVQDGANAGTTATFEQSLSTTISAGDDITVTEAELGGGAGTVYSFF
ncbi:MAG: hypothetical protein ACRDZ2_10780, partial [Ilumatobacteraceae bacterium]